MISKIPNYLKLFLSIILISGVGLPGVSLSQDSGSSVDIYSGYYSRDGNNKSPSETINNNIYIKLFEDQWIATLYIPLPYGSTVGSVAIDKALGQAKLQTTTSAYIRGKFGQLTEPATVRIEKFGYLEDRIVFECGSLAPCTIKMGDGFLELIKPGMLNEHIIRYIQIVGS
jgi:hypothetical protein